jgi:pyruvate kinase
MTEARQFRRTKIVATLGPACADEPVLSELLESGVDVVRINSSHGDPSTWSEWMGRVRQISDRLERHVGVLVDLQGPRIRVGKLPQPVELAQNAEVVFAPQGDARAGEIPTTYDALAGDLHPEARILLDDGLLSVDVTRIEGDRVHGVVRFGGTLRSNKGINLPGVEVSAPTVTARDRENLEVALEHGADFIAVSFVRRAADVEEVRALVPAEVGIVAKIEKPEAIDDITRILETSDALMVARGDLGVELRFEEVPLIQKRLIIRGNRRARPVITATQMLESMVQTPRPTRAEASDVANAILDGTDAVMLSAETAIGRYPVKAVKAMVRIIAEIEGQMDSDALPRRRRSDAPGPLRPRTAEDAIAFATGVAAQMLQVPLIVCFTKSGFTARKIAANRPVTPILGLSTEQSTCRSLSLVWGVAPVLADHAPTYEAMLGRAREQLLARGVVEPGDRIVVTAGVPFDVTGTTNLLKIETI